MKKGWASWITCLLLLVVLWVILVIMWCTRPRDEQEEVEQDEAVAKPRFTPCERPSSSLRKSPSPVPAVSKSYAPKRVERECPGIRRGDALFTIQRHFVENLHLCLQPSALCKTIGDAIQCLEKGCGPIPGFIPQLQGLNEELLAQLLHITGRGFGRLKRFRKEVKGQIALFSRTVCDALEHLSCELYLLCSTGVTDFNVYQEARAQALQIIATACSSLAAQLSVLFELLIDQLNGLTSEAIIDIEAAVGSMQLAASVGAALIAQLQSFLSDQTAFLQQQLSAAQDCVSSEVCEPLTASLSEMSFDCTFQFPALGLSLGSCHRCRCHPCECRPRPPRPPPNPTGPTGPCPPCTQCILAGPCVDLQNDPAHCGECSHPCRPDQVCLRGTCQCPPGLFPCFNACVPLNDPMNCGSCGLTCGVGQVCQDGVCQCPPGLEFCQGVCRNTQSDNTACGSDCVPCPTGTVCVQGRCTLICPPGLLPCQGNCIAPLTDPQNCGGCGLGCTAGNLCVGGVCTNESCQAPGLTACDGVCTNTNVDPAHCGSCNNSCGTSETCVNGECVADCPPGFSLICNGVCINPNTDAAHCGSCAPCPNQGQVCVNGTCQCPTGSTLCNGVCLPVSVFATDSRNCGQCGNVCPTGSYCVGGTCASCASGGSGCSCSTCEHSLCGNQCVDLLFDPNNCAYCGNSVGPGSFCYLGLNCSVVNSPNCSNPVKPSLTCTISNTSGCNECPCPPGQVCCFGACFAPDSNPCNSIPAPTNCIT